MQSSPLFGALEAMLRWLGARIRPLMPEGFTRKLDRQITLAGDYWGLKAEEFIALSLMSLTGGTLVGSLYGVLLKKGALYTILGAALGAALPYLQVSGVEQERLRRIQNGLPYVIDLLSLGLSAGLDFPGALRQVLDKSSNPDDPLIEELGLILQELQVGKTRKHALLQFAERVPGETVREFVGAIVQAEERGSPLSSVLKIQADSLRQRRSVRAEEAASHASLKIMGPMVLVFAAILLLIVAPMFLELRGSLAAD
jgi:tight adherence protein C